jgi:excisionase family DNA binding protein
VTTTEAAKMLGVSGSRIRELLASGQIPGTKHGPVWVIRRRDVEAYKKLEPGSPGHPRTLRKKR